MTGENIEFELIRIHKKTEIHTHIKKNKLSLLLIRD